MSDRLMNSNLVGIGIVLLILGGGAFMLVSAVTGQGSADAVNEEINNDNEPFLGSEDAEVTVAYFGDYNCSSCLIFEQNVFPGFEDQLLDNGEVKFVKKNFPVVTHQSPDAAQASRSVWNQVNETDQELFWEWHEHIYNHQEGYGSNWATRDRIVQLPSQIDGLDAEKVRDDMEQETYDEQVQRNLDEGRAVGVRGTPTFVVYNELTRESEQLVGPQPLTEFETAIENVR